MDREEKEDTRGFVVVVNHEEQFALWPEGKEALEYQRLCGSGQAGSEEL